MHKLIDYICDELEQLERKADKGKLSMSEIQYMDVLAHAKKNLLTGEAMMESEEYSMEGGMSNARGRGRNARRDSMGRYSSRGGSYEGRSYEGGSYDDYDMSMERGGGNRGGGNRGNNRGGGRSNARGYSRDSEELVETLRELEMDTQDEETRRMIQKFIKQAEM